LADRRSAYGLGQTMWPEFIRFILHFLGVSLVLRIVAHDV